MSKKVKKNVPYSAEHYQPAKVAGTPLRAELFLVPRFGNILDVKEHWTGEEKAFVGKYLELADIALNSEIGESSTFQPASSGPRAGNAEASTQKPYIFSRKDKAA